jgi:diguanylate cyclase (GGDEF)-like protein
METPCDCLIPEDIILIVDDVPENLRFLSCLLSQRGYDVRAAINGPMALTVVKSASPSLILLDIMMPEMDGYEICRELKTDPQTSDIPVIFLSALDEVRNKINAFEVGGVDYITKPFHAAEVLARVKTHITLRHLQQKLEMANKELHRLVNIDGLTLVANRRRFDEYLEYVWHRLAREQLPFSLILCDVDFFKTYNDLYGHQAGDECLRCLANVLNIAARHPDDLVARYGGEEFAVVLPNTSTMGALQVAQNIQAEIRRSQYAHDGSSISSYVTLSIGITTIVPEIGQFSSQLVAAADKALYQAKVEGRDLIIVNNTVPSCML